ncbi:MAG: hypothetical protein ACYSX0_07670 [Planctomycetota bacterium]
MYEGSTFERWGTPVSDARDLRMTRLVDEDRLCVSVIGECEGREESCDFVFRGVVAYRNTHEEYQSELWELLKGASPWSLTFVLPASKWLEDLRVREPAMQAHAPNAVHYLIITLHDVIEVLASEAPEITIGT